MLFCIKQMMVYNYDDEEWNNVIPKDPEWSKEETEYLISLCEQFDLRFLVITDRYDVSALSHATHALVWF
jgi:DNA methyltransferase 1-associated protein 1